jgi:hypothetical protein
VLSIVNSCLYEREPGVGSGWGLSQNTNVDEINDIMRRFDSLLQDNHNEGIYDMVGIQI